MAETNNMQVLSVVKIFNYYSSMLRLTPLSRLCHSLLFCETGRHNLTGTQQYLLVFPDEDVLKTQLPRKLVGDGRTVSPWNPLRRSVGKCKFYTNSALHTCPRIGAHIDGSCIFNFIEHS
jgi:hypothetical protein